MSAKTSVLQLQYGVNVHANHVYGGYRPLPSTAYYPDPESTDLRDAVANYVGCDKSMVICGNGSDELIDLYLRIQLMHHPKLKVAISPPTYYQYENYGSRIGAEIVHLPHDRSLINAALLMAHDCQPDNSIIMLDSPANPSGDMVTREQFIELLEAGYQVFADEAYYEFYDETVVDLINRYPEQLVVSRSLSKIAAMAGSRVGYLIANPEMIESFYRQKLFFNLASESQHKGLYALAHMAEFKAALAGMREVKGKLEEEVQAIGAYKLFNSLPMYMIFCHHSMTGEELHQALRGQGIETYRFPNFKGYDVIRAAVLEAPIMQRLVTALKAV